jgi:tetratricopeptide (TPR) repeat protein
MNKSKAVTSPPPHTRFDRKNALIGLIVLVILVAGGVYWVMHRSKDEPASKVPQYSGQALVTEVNKRYGQHDYAGVINLLKGQKSIDEPATQLLLAGAYTNKGDFASAVVIYEKLEKQGALDETYAATAADAAERGKQYQKAIDFYKKAKERAPSDATDQKAVYDYKIAELEKKL